MNLTAPISRVSAAVGGALRRAFPGSLRDTAHLGASRTAREVAEWRVHARSSNDDVVPEVGAIAARSRDLDRNNALAQNIRVVKGDHIIGTGLQLSPMPNWRVLEPALLADPEWVAEWGERGAAAWAADWARRVKAHWSGYSETRFIDAEGRDNLTAQLRLVQDSRHVDGAGCMVPMWLDRPGTPYRTCFRVIESDRLCDPADRTFDRQRIRGGVETDRIGQVVAYWVRNDHPNEISTSGHRATWTRIPAFLTNGRRAFIHVYNRHRPGQSRGVAAATAVLAAFGLHGKYQLTELQAAVVNSKIAGVLKTPMSDEALVSIFGDESSDYLDELKNFRGELTPGTILNLPPGTDFDSHNPGRPSNAYAPFMQYIGREIAAGFGLPFELSHRDFSQTSYHSARAALLQAELRFDVERDEIEHQCATPVYELWLEDLVDLGLVEAPGYAEHRAAYSRCRWLSRGMSPIDELKHQKAITEGLLNGSMTRQRMAEREGRDWIEDMEQQFREALQEKEFEEQFGVTLRRSAGTRPSAVGEALDGGESDLVDDMTPAQQNGTQDTEEP